MAFKAIPVTTYGRQNFPLPRRLHTVQTNFARASVLHFPMRKVLNDLAAAPSLYAKNLFGSWTDA